MCDDSSSTLLATVGHDLVQQQLINHSLHMPQSESVKQNKALSGGNNGAEDELEQGIEIPKPITVRQ